MCAPLDIQPDHVEAPRPREPQHRLHRDQITGQGDAARWPAAARSESGACVRRVIATDVIGVPIMLPET